MNDTSLAGLAAPEIRFSLKSRPDTLVRAREVFRTMRVTGLVLLLVSLASATAWYLIAPPPAGAG
jgi:hypothetical protein